MAELKMKYGDIGNKTLYARYEIETDEGLRSTSKMDRLIEEDKTFKRMGVKNVCPHCQRECAMFLGDVDGDHWCLMCQILADPEGRR